MKKKRKGETEGRRGNCRKDNGMTIADVILHFQAVIVAFVSVIATSEDNLSDNRYIKIVVAAYLGISRSCARNGI